jgi:phage shock protein A
LQRLDKEKEDFAVQMKEFEDRFKKIKTFDSIDAVNDTVKDTMDLRNSLDNAKDKIEQFNEREQTFAQAPSEWPALDTLEKDFKPFYDLLDVGFNVGSMI